LISAGLSAVIAFCSRAEKLMRPFLKTVLHVGQPVEIFAGRGKIMLPEKIPRRLDFRVPDRRSALDPLLQSFHQFLDLPPALFCGHVGIKKLWCSVTPSGKVTTVRLDAHPLKSKHGRRRSAFRQAPAVAQRQIEWLIVPSKQLCSNRGNEAPIFKFHARNQSGPPSVFAKLRCDKHIGCYPFWITFSEPFPRCEWRPQTAVLSNPARRRSASLTVLREL